MFEKPKRFRDSGRSTAFYAFEVHVYCVRCKVPGLVRAQHQRYCWRASFHCHSCQLQLESDQHDWVGPVQYSGRRPCGYCGHQWLTPKRLFKTLPKRQPKTIAAACPKCSHSTRVDVQLHQLPDPHTDPHFGLALRLIARTRHGLIWVYNAKHLKDLQAFISADLRELQSWNRSSVAYLPEWIKRAKNRALVLDVFEKFEKQLIN